MAGENLNVRVGLQFDPRDAVARANATAEAIRKIFSQVGQQEVATGGLSTAAAHKFGDDLEREVRRAFRQGMEGSQFYKETLRGADRAAVNRQIATGPIQTHPLTPAILREINALRALERATATRVKTYTPTTGPFAGEELKGYGSQTKRLSAITAAQERVATASLAVARAEEKYAADILKADAERAAGERRRQEAQARETVAITNRAEREALRERQMQTAAGREILAIQGRAEQDARAARSRQEGYGREILALRARAVAEEKAARAAQTAAGREILAVQRRTEQADRLARRQAGADAARGFQVAYPGAFADQSALGRAQGGVNVAQRRLAIAEANRADILQDANRTTQKVLASENAVDQANRALAAARHRVTQEEIRAKEVLSQLNASRNQQKAGFAQQFGLGFKGASDRPYAEQLGQAFKFSLFYGTAYKLLFALTQTFQQTLTEGIAFQNAVTELRLATGQAQESAEALAEGLGRDASQYGFAPSQGAIIGARAQGYYGTTGADAATQAQVAGISAKIVNQLAFASGKQPQDLQANLAAVTQAYGLGAQSQQYIADLDAYFSRKFGAEPGSTIGAVAQAGTVGRAAGFSPAELQAISASIIARTGASEAAAGGYLAQIFSRAGEGSLTALTSRYGIKDQDFAGQFRQLASVYAQRPEERDDISAAFGRGKVQNAVIALLQDFPRVQEEVANAQKEAAGELGKATELRMSDVGGQIQQTVGALRLFANELGQAGVLDILGAGVVVLRELVEAATGVLEAFNEIPRPIRDAIVAIGLLAAASRVAAAATGMGFGAGLLSRGGVATASTLAGRRAVVGAAGQAVPLFSRAGAAVAGRGALAAAGSAAAAYGPAALALASIYAATKVRESSRKYADAAEGAAAFLESHTEDLSTIEGVNARAASAAAAAQGQRDAAGGFIARFKNLGADKDAALLSANRLESEQRRLEDFATYLQEKPSTADSRSAIIQGFDEESITTGLEAIARSGGTAAEQFDALAAALEGGADAAARVRSEFDPKVVAGPEASASLYERLLGKQGANVFGRKFGGAAFGNLPFMTGTKPNALAEGLDKVFPGDQSGAFTSDTTVELIEGLITEKDISRRFEEALEGLDPANITEADKKNITQKILGDLGNQVVEEGDFSWGDAATIRAGLIQLLLPAVSDILDDATAAVSEFRTLTAEELTFRTQNLLATAEGAIGEEPETAYGARIHRAQRLVDKIKESIDRTAGGATPRARKDLAAAQHLLAEGEYNRLEALRQVAEQNAQTDAEAKAIGARFRGREIRSAIRNQDPDLLARIISEAGEGAIAIARRAIRQAQRAARAALEMQQRIGGMGRALAATDTDFAHGTGGTGGAGLDALWGVTETTAYAEEAGGADTGETAAQRAVAKRQAQAIRSQSGIAAARADIYAARVAMQEAEKGTVEYYNALGSYYQARQSLTAAIIDYRSNLYLLSHDITDPLTQARAAVQAAAAQLRADRRSGAGPDKLAEDRVALQQAQADRESTAFNQRLEAVQTADELGRISHQKYLSYLQHEHDRLSGIKNRTYQQQQQLDQIDRLMKDAANAMAGQWNFGDIRLPTPYEVKRRTQQLYGDLVNGPRGDASPFMDPTGPQGPRREGNTAIYIDGTDIGQVKKILTEILGDRANRNATVARHS